MTNILKMVNALIVKTDSSKIHKEMPAHPLGFTISLTPKITRRRLMLRLKLRLNMQLQKLKKKLHKKSNADK